ncbi:MAG: restriction endonuclease [Candidatus Scalinduaceae bacterium]
MVPEQIDLNLNKILKQYSESFLSKKFGEESYEVDELMQVYGLTQGIKKENKQYWGRELGMCWQLLITELFRLTCKDFKGAIKDGSDEICDLVTKKDAIDTKYRIGSGDSGTLKKFKQYGKRIKELGYNPIILILRTDNLKAAITACHTGGWTILSGEKAYKYITKKTGFDLKKWLKSKKNLYKVRHTLP